jgi:hypothetical protein
VHPEERDEHAAAMQFKQVFLHQGDAALPGFGDEVVRGEERVLREGEREVQ